MSAQLKGRRRSQQSDMDRLLDQLARECRNPARVVELFYWSQEPDLAEIMRQIIALPDQAKSTLHAFFRLAEGDLRSVAVSVNASGDLTLSCPTVGHLLDEMDASGVEKPPQSMH